RLSVPRRANGPDCDCAASGAYEAPRIRQYQAETSKPGLSHASVEALDRFAVAWHRKQQLGKAWRLQAFKLPQPLVFIRGHYDHGRPAVLRHQLRLLLRCLDDLAESVLGVLERPFASGHGLGSF